MASKGMSIADLARAISEPYDKVKAWFKERTDNPRGDAMEKVARTLDVAVEWLRYGTSRRMLALSPLEQRIINALRNAPEGEQESLVDNFEKTCAGARSLATMDES